MSRKYGVIMFVLLSLVVYTTYFFDSKNSLPKSKVDEVLFSNSSQSIFFAWDRAVTIHLISKDKNAEKSIQKAIDEINAVVGYKKTTLGPLYAAQVIIITSKIGFEDFSIEYKRLFHQWFGAEQTELWDKKGAFNFTYDETHQCFGFGLYNPQNFATAGYIDKNRPEKFLISIGDMGTFTEESLMGCVREEVAHGVFFIRDFIVENANFSIFNSNAMPNLIEDYSQFDRNLMYYIANTPNIVGMPRSDVVRLVQRILRDNLN